MKDLIAKFRSFTNDENGSFAILFTVAIFAFFGVIGLSLDYARTINDRTHAHNALDSAVLIAARAAQNGKSVAQAKKIGQDAFIANMGPDYNGPAQLELEVEELGEGKFRAAGNVSSTTPTVIMQVMPGADDTVDWKVSSAAEVAASEDMVYEVAVAADISASMDRKDRFPGMKKGIGELVDIMFPDGEKVKNRYLSILPFGTNVNFGQQARDWLRYRADSKFAGCFRYEASYQNSIQDSSGKLTTHLQARNKSTGRTHCPTDRSKVRLFSKDGKGLKTYIKNFELSQGTGSSIALSWAWRALSPEWQTPMRKAGYGDGTLPLKHSKGTKKMLILFSDGAPYTTDPEGDTPIVGERDGVKLRQIAQERYKKVCASIKRAKNINLYTIAYSAGKDAEDRMRNCVAGEGKFFAADTENLGEVFKTIIQETMALKLTN